jgi:hypothetical protein
MLRIAPKHPSGSAALLPICPVGQRGVHAGEQQKARFGATASPAFETARLLLHPQYVVVGSRATCVNKDVDIGLRPESNIGRFRQREYRV